MLPTINWTAVNVTPTKTYNSPYFQMLRSNLTAYLCGPEINPATQTCNSSRARVTLNLN